MNNYILYVYFLTFLICTNNSVYYLDDSHTALVSQLFFYSIFQMIIASHFLTVKSTTLNVDGKGIKFEDNRQLKSESNYKITVIVVYQIMKRIT